MVVVVVYFAYYYDAATYYHSSNKINSSSRTSLCRGAVSARNEVFRKPTDSIIFLPSCLVFSSYGAYGKRNTGSAHPSIVNAVFTPIGFGSLNNHRMRGIKSSRSFGFGFWPSMSSLHEFRGNVRGDGNNTSRAGVPLRVVRLVVVPGPTRDSILRVIANAFVAFALLPPAKFGCFASSKITSDGISCVVRAGTLYTIVGPKSKTAPKCFINPARLVFP